MNMKLRHDSIRSVNVVGLACAMACLLATTANAVTIATTTSGNWTNTATWVGGVPPGSSDRAEIYHDVTITNDVGTISILDGSVSGSVTMNGGSLSVTAGDWNEVQSFSLSNGSTLDFNRYTRAKGTWTVDGSSLLFGTVPQSWTQIELRSNFDCTVRNGSTFWTDSINCSGNGNQQTITAEGASNTLHAGYLRNGDGTGDTNFEFVMDDTDTALSTWTFDTLDLDFETRSWNLIVDATEWNGVNTNFTLFDATTLTGTFDSTNIIGASGSVSYDANDDVVLTLVNTSTDEYWDNNGATAGFGTAGGTWAVPTVNQLSTDDTGASAPAASTSSTADSAVYFGTAADGLATGTITVSGTVEANSLIFGSASGDITLSGGIIELGGDFPSISVDNTSNTISSAVSNTIGIIKKGSGAVTLSGANSDYTGDTTINAGTLQIGGAGQLEGGSYDGTIAIGSGATFDYSSSADQTLSGDISGDGLLTKGSSGTLSLSGANTYVGNTTVNSGSLKLSGGSSIPDGSSKGDVTVDGTLDLNGTSETINGLSGSGTVDNTSATASTLTVGKDNDTSSFSGTIASSAGALTFNKSGSGTLTLTGTGNSLADVSAAGGNLVLAGNSTTTLSGTMNVSNSDVSGGGNGTLIVTNDASLTVAGGFYMGRKHNRIGTAIQSGGTVTLNGTDIKFGLYNGAEGLYTISGGTLNVLNGSVILGWDGYGVLSVNGGVANLKGARVDWRGNESDEIDILNLNGGTLNIGSDGIDKGAASGANAYYEVNLNGGTLAASAGWSSDADIALGGSVDIDTTGGDISFSGAFSGTGGFTKTTAGTIVLSGANGHSGGTTVEAGTLELAHSTAGGNGALVIDDGTLDISVATADMADNTVSLISGSIAGNTLSADAGGAFDLRAGTVDAVLAGAAALTKSTPGTVVLSGVNAHTGGTTVEAGTLQLTHSAAAGDGALTVTGGTLDIDVATADLADNTVSLVSGTIAGNTLSVDAGGAYSVQSGSVNAVLAGGAALTKTTAGTVVLTGENLYSGATTISGGTLQVDGSLAAGSSVTVAGSATLSGSGTVNGAVVVQAGGTVAPGASTGALTASDDLTFESGSTFAVEVDDAQTPACDTLVVSGALDISGATLDISVTGSPSASGYVIATYPAGQLTGAFVATNGVPAGYTLVTDALGGTAITLEQPTAPVVDNAGGATDQTADSALLRGRMTEAGSALAWICWGDDNVGTDSTSVWDHVEYVGPVTDNVVFSQPLTDLTPNKTYYYRCYVTNAYGAGWSDEASAFNAIGESGAGAAYSMQISFTNFVDRGTLTNFPALVKLTTSNTDNYDGFLNSDGYELRFWTNSTLTGTELNYEIEEFDSASNSYVWVQVPFLTNNCSIWASWGDSANTNQESYTTNGAVWTEGFVGVWHMNQANALDSTANRNNGTASGNVNTVGLIGGGQGFNGGQQINAGNGSSFGGLQAVTISYWFKPTTSNGRMPLSKGSFGDFYSYDNGAGNTSLALFWAAGGSREVYSTGAPFTRNSWHMFTGTWQSSSTGDGKIRIYADGALNNTGANADNATIKQVNNLYLGGAASSYYFTGLEDEIRIESVSRSTNWIWACWMNQGETHDAFVEYGAIVPPDPIKNTGASGISDTSATLNATLTAEATSYDVYVHWGTVDRGENDTWASSASVDAISNVDSTNISFDVSNLIPGVQYSYTFRASNATEEVWASPSWTFRSVGEATIAPVLTNGGGPTDETADSAVLRGELSFPDNATAWICWGDNDAGTGGTGQWDNVDYIGLVDQGLVFSNLVSPLTVNKSYYYRCYATNTHGSGWSDDTASFTTAGEANVANYSMMITFTNFANRGVLTNFPALVKLSTGNTDSYAGFLNSDGYELRFWTNSAFSGTELNYEIEAFDSTGDSYIWVKIPELTNNLSIWANWGDAAFSSQETYTTNGDVWSAGYGGVWHFATANDFSDATANAIDGSNAGSTDAAGVAGRARFFDGANDTITLSGDLQPVIGQDKGSLSFWIKTDSVNDDGSGWNGTCLLGRDNPYLDMWWGFTYNDRIGIRNGNSAPVLSAQTIINDTWRHVVLTRNAADGFVEVYVDGLLDNSGTLSTGPGNAGNTLNAFGRNMSGGHVVGHFDEIRAISKVLSSNWVWACWMNQGANHDAFAQYTLVATSSIQNQAPAGITHGTAALTANLATPTSPCDVYVHWGTTDQTTNDTWDASAFVGSWTNVASTNISYSASGLFGATTHYYTFRASNDVGNVWASPSWEFVTPRFPGSLLRFR